MPVNDAFLQELRYKIDIEDIISSYVSLKRHGSTLKGLCRFITKKRRPSRFIPKRSLFIASVAARAATR